MRNIPVAIEQHGVEGLYLFTDFTTGGQCVARTRSRRRCRNVVWDQGQAAAYGRVWVGTRILDVYGPLTGEVAEAYLEQVCRVHRSPDVNIYCDPEWQRFDVDRHGEQFLRAPRWGDLGLIKPFLEPRQVAALLVSEYDGAQLTEFVTTLRQLTGEAV
jgi:hypothetical protein